MATTNDSGWTFDPHRREYFYINQVEQCYVYQSGNRIPFPTSLQGSSAANQRQADPNAPRYDQNAGYQTTLDRAGDRKDKQGTEADSDGNEEEEDDDYDEDEGDASQNPIPGFGNLSVATPTGYNYAGYAGSSSASGIGYGYGAGSAPRSNTRDDREEEGDEEEDTVGTTLQSRLKDGLKPRGKIRGNRLSGDPKDPEYKVRRGADFFRIGKVFKVYWPEPMGNPNDMITMTVVTEDNKVASKIRWFIVVKEDKRFCTCVPIKTYQNQGVAKRGVVKWHHSIAFSEKDEPLPAETEWAKPHETGMLPGIRIEINKRKDKLHRMSRIDFARNYTVEHNVRVYDFGWVDRQYIARLRSQWIYVLLGGNTQGVDLQSLIPDPVHSSEDDDEDDEDEEGDEGEQRKSRTKGKSKSSSSKKPERSDRKDRDRDKDKDERSRRTDGRRRR